MKTPYITLVNLLAERELFPEFLTDRCEGVKVADRMLAWLNDPVALASLQHDLTELRDRVAQPGACARTAQYILSTLAGQRISAAA